MSSTRTSKEAICLSAALPNSYPFVVDSIADKLVTLSKLRNTGSNELHDFVRQQFSSAKVHIPVLGSVSCVLSLRVRCGRTRECVCVYT